MKKVERGKKIVLALEEKIREADAAYYSTSESVMTDQEYDGLKKELQKLDPDNSLLSSVGAPAVSSWKKASHQTPMGSLNNVFTEDEFRKWASKFPEGTVFTAQPKLDGLSLAMTYKDSVFERGITRGDGETGEDITRNVMRMRGCVKKTGSTYSGTIRAEIMLPTEDFVRINEGLPEDQRYKNPRNAAAGICRRLDSRFCESLVIMPYNHSYDSPEDYGVEGEDENVKIETLKHMGFRVPGQIVGGVNMMIKTYKGMAERRDSYPFGIDGMVVKVCSWKIQEESGLVNMRPRAQVAWKFEAPGAVTVLHEVTWDVGRTGVVTPLGHVDPVEIEGSTIRRVTLHNVAEIERLGVGIGDEVMLVKAGDIIPKIKHVIKAHGEPIVIPEVCPSCGSVLLNDAVRLFCPEEICPRKTFNRILNWIKVSEIDSFGESLAMALDDRGKLSSIADIYGLDAVDITGLDKWGPKSAQKVVDNIQASKDMTPEQFLAACGIPGVSIQTAKELLAGLGSLDAVLEATIPQIMKLPGFSDTSAGRIIFGIRKFKDEIKGLKMIINLTEKAKGKLDGMSFCFTGAMEHPRKHYQTLVEENGGENHKSVTKTTTHLVCNEDRGSNKTQKAKKYGTKVMTEAEFLTMVKISPENVVEEEKPTFKNINLFAGDE